MVLLAQCQSRQPKFHCRPALIGQGRISQDMQRRTGYSPAHQGLDQVFGRRWIVQRTKRTHLPAVSACFQPLEVPDVHPRSSAKVEPASPPGCIAPPKQLVRSQFGLPRSFSFSS